jgi:hypothetical protein
MSSVTFGSAACRACPTRQADTKTSRRLYIMATPAMPLILIAAIIADAIIVLSIVIWVSHSD